MPHKINVKLGNVGQAVRDLQKYREYVLAKTTELVRVLCQNGVTIASDHILNYDAIETGELDSSIFYGVSADGTKGFIRADSKHAIFVEFGTGIKGTNQGHALAGKFGYRYDVNNHGEDGWYYFDEKQNRIRYTRGMPSRPFMFRTSVELADSLEKTAREVFET